MIDVDEYKETTECVYKGEQYSVRDNGAVMRHLREGKRPRKDDGVWTFGVKNNANGYMLIGSHRVHIIVATAFYGERDSKVYVVDHRKCIDESCYFKACYISLWRRYYELYKQSIMLT